MLIKRKELLEIIIKEKIHENLKSGAFALLIKPEGSKTVETINFTMYRSFLIARKGKSLIPLHIYKISKLYNYSRT